MRVGSSISYIVAITEDRFCGLVVRVPGHRSKNPGSIRGATTVMGLERGSLSLVITTEELLRRKSRGSGLEIRECGCRDPSRLPRDNSNPKKCWH
jgi:hypothetical protein